MITHVVLLRWNEDAPADQSERVAAALNTLPGIVTSLRSYHVGADIGLREGNADFGVVATFDDAAGWHAYDQDPEHQRILAEVIRPHLASRLATQFET